MAGVVGSGFGMVAVGALVSYSGFGYRLGDLKLGFSKGGCRWVHRLSCLSPQKWHNR